MISSITGPLNAAFNVLNRCNENASTEKVQRFPSQKVPCDCCLMESHGILQRTGHEHDILKGPVRGLSVLYPLATAGSRAENHMPCQVEELQRSGHPKKSFFRKDLEGSMKKIINAQSIYG